MITEEELIETIKDFPGISICVNFSDIHRRTRHLTIFLKSDVFCEGESRIADFYFNEKLKDILNGSRTLYANPMFIGDGVCLNAVPAIKKTIKTKEDILNFVIELVEKLKQFKVKMKLKDLEKDFV